jgi:cobalt/nickel transport system permease protein
MHIAEGFLPPLHAGAWTVASAPFVVHGFRVLKRRLDAHPEEKVMVAASGAFAFVLSALKIPSVNGSSSHPTGVGLGAVMFGPTPMAALGSIVLTFQALLLAHGGLTTLGANVFSMGVVGPMVSWWIYVGLRRLGVALDIGGGVAAAVGALSTYVVSAVQLALAHPDVNSGFVGSLGKFLGIFAITQLPLAAVEGAVTMLALRWVLTRSSIDLASPRTPPRQPFGRRSVWLVVAAIIGLVTFPLVARRSAQFIGSDSRATSAVRAVDPGYEQWFAGWWSPPSGGVESFLFTLQAAVGAGVVGYVVGSRRRTAVADVPVHAPVHQADAPTVAAIVEVSSEHTSAQSKATL